MSFDDLSTENEQEIKGASDGTKIGNVGDRLKVTGDDGEDFKPRNRVVHIDRRFANGSNTSMDVNASVGSPQDFEFGPPSGETWFIRVVAILITDSGSSDVGDFGAISGGLSNGVQFIQQIDGTEYQLGNFNDNASLSLCFAENPITASGSNESTGWFDSADFFMGTKILDPPVELRGNDGDKMILRIRDDLRGLNDFEAVGRAWREL